MTTTSLSTRRVRGIHPKGGKTQRKPRGKGSTLPEYLEALEVQVLIAAAPHPRAKLLMLTQWRTGLRFSEALALERTDLSLNSDLPTLRVRRGKGGKSRVVPVHPELQNSLTSVLEFVDVGDGRITDVDRSTAWRWVQAAVRRAVELGANRAGSAGRHSHAAPQLRQALVGERYPAELPQPVAGALRHQDDSDLPGAGARPKRELGTSAVR